MNSQFGLPWRGGAGRGEVWQCLASHTIPVRGGCSEARRAKVRPGLAWQGQARQSSASHIASLTGGESEVGQCSARLAPAGLGCARHRRGKAGLYTPLRFVGAEVRRVVDGLAVAWRGSARHGMACLGTVGLSVAWRGFLHCGSRTAAERLGDAWRGEARRCMAWRGGPRRGAAIPPARKTAGSFQNS